MTNCKNCVYWEKYYDEPYVDVEYGRCLCSQWGNNPFNKPTTTATDFCSYAKEKTI